MVVYFTSNVVNPPAAIFMGFDKHENEDLIRWGWPEDVWFHVDKLSSAHVYLRLCPGQGIEDIPEALVEDCAQLVKANSIQGNKINNVGVVYTMWENLKKTGDMAVGQVGFHRDNQVKKVMVEKRLNEIVNRLNKTKIEKTDVEFRIEREERDAKERTEKKAEARKQKKLEEEEAKRTEEEKKLRSYDTLMSTDNMKTNKDGYDSDDFM